MHWINQRILKELSLAILVCWVSNIYAVGNHNKPDTKHIGNKLSHLGLKWVENKGQYPNEVAFGSKTFAGGVFVTRNAEIVYSLSNQLVVREKPITQLKPKVKGIGQTGTKVNYFMNREAKDWHTNINVFEDIDFGEPWPGIDMQLKSHGTNIEKLFCVRAGAIYSNIAMQVKDAKLRITRKGELSIKTNTGKMSFTKPVAWQWLSGQKVFIEVKYHLKNKDTYGFELGAYDGTRDVFIDPLIASTFLGGKGGDEISDFLIDSSGDLFVVGGSYLVGFPLSDSLLNSNNYSFFVAKLSADLSKLLSISFITSTNSVSGSWNKSIAINSIGDIYISITTKDSLLPISGNPVFNTKFGGEDVYIARFSNDLNTLKSSTYFGGNQNEYLANYIAVDKNDNVFLGGSTFSKDIPVTSQAFDTSFSDYTDVFVAKFNADLSVLLASTYLGGVVYDYLSDMVVDKSGELLLSGLTSSYDFPFKGKKFGNNIINGGDLFIAKLNNQLSDIIVSIELGGRLSEAGSSICIDASGDIIIAASTSSSDYPVTFNSYDKTYNGGGSDIVITRFDSALTEIKSSTYLGGTKLETYNTSGWRPYITTDYFGNIWVTAWTKSDDFPYTSNAYDSTFNGVSDMFVSAFSGDLSNLIWSTFIGGSGEDLCTAIQTNKDGNIYISGFTYSPNYPTTTHAYDSLFNNTEGLISRFGFFKTGNFVKHISICDGQIAALIAGLHGGFNVWNNGTTSDSIFVTDSGTYTCFSIKGDSIRLDTFIVTKFYPKSRIVIDTLCQGDSMTLNASGSQQSKWLWNTTDTTKQITIHDSGFYQVTIRDTMVCPS